LSTALNVKEAAKVVRREVVPTYCNLPFALITKSELAALRTVAG
jgi:hypothetical protein